MSNGFHAAIHYSKSSAQNSNNSASTSASVVALTPEDEYSRFSNNASLNKSASLVFDRFNSKAASSSSNLVHSYSTSAIVKNPQQNIMSRVADTSNFADSNFYQDGKLFFVVETHFTLTIFFIFHRKSMSKEKNS